MKGSLYQRGNKSKTWYLRYDIPPASGNARKQKNVRIGKMSKADAEVRKREILRQVDEGTYQEERSSMTVGAFLKSWLEETRDDLATTTHVRYTNLIERHVLPVIGQLLLAKVAPEHVKKLHKFVREEGLSNRTCLHVHRVLHTALNYAVREKRILKENVVSLVKAPRVPKGDRLPMSRDQVRLLIEAARGTRLEVPVVFAALTGLRRGELLALRWRNVNLEKGFALRHGVT